MKCHACKAGEFVESPDGVVWVDVVEGIRFAATVPGKRCNNSACNDVMTSMANIEAIELRVSWALLASGWDTGNVLRYARKALGWSDRMAFALALNTLPSAVSRWESDVEGIPRAQLVALARMIRQVIHGADQREADIPVLLAASPQISNGNYFDLGRVGFDDAIPVAG